MIDRVTVLEALSRVRDPELDEPVSSMGFVRDVTIRDRDIAVRLRLPTYYCAPNFAFLMVHDAKRILESLLKAGHVTVHLEAHFASDEINAGVAADGDFGERFPGKAEGDLEDLRTLSPQGDPAPPAGRNIRAHQRWLVARPTVRGPARRRASRQRTG